MKPKNCVMIFSEKYLKGLESEKVAQEHFKKIKNKLDQKKLDFFEEDDGFCLKIFINGELVKKAKEIASKNKNDIWYKWFKKNLLL